MKAFISYSTREKKHAGNVKAVFSELGIDCFLAHEDLHVSEQWKKRIVEELKTCKVFVPLLSKAFKASKWCSQETGFIVSRRGVLVLPLSIDGTTPYGFISHIQGSKRLDDGDVEKELILDAIAKKFPSYVIDQLLRPMEKVWSFRQAETVVKPLVPYFTLFSMPQAKKFADLALKNGQIWDAHLCKDEYLPRFLKVNKEKIGKTAYRTLKQKIKRE